MVGFFYCVSLLSWYVNWIGVALGTGVAGTYSFYLWIRRATTIALVKLGSVFGTVVTISQAEVEELMVVAQSLLVIIAIILFGFWAWHDFYIPPALRRPAAPRGPPTPPDAVPSGPPPAAAPEPVLPPVAAAPGVAAQGPAASDFLNRMGLVAPGAALGSFGLSAPPSVLDSRIFEVVLDGDDRWRTFEDVARRVSGPTPTQSVQWKSQISGEASGVSCFKRARRAGSFTDHHRLWMTKSNIDQRKPHAHEHFILCLAIDMFAMFDQVNLPSLLGGEILLRRMQLLESAYEQGVHGAPDFFHSDDMMGLNERPSGAIISPELEDSCAEHLKQRALIAKEIRKAREPAPKAKAPHVPKKPSVPSGGAQA